MFGSLSEQGLGLLLVEALDFLLSPQRTKFLSGEIGERKINLVSCFRKGKNVRARESVCGFHVLTFLEVKNHERMRKIWISQLVFEQGRDLFHGSLIEM